MYLGHSPFNAGSVSLVQNPSTGHVSTQFHVVFYADFSTVPFMREGKIPKNWTDLVQHSSQSGAPGNIELKYTWFTPYLEEDPSKTPTHVLRVSPENIMNIITFLQSVQQGQEILVSEGESVSEVIKRPVSEGV